MTVSGTKHTISGVTETTSFTLTVSDDNGNTDSKTINVEFLNYIAYGISFDSSATVSTIAALRTKILSDNAERVINVDGGGKYIYYAYPKRLGAVKFFTNDKLFEGGFKAAQTVQYTNSAGYTEEYYVYRSANELTGNIQIEIIKEA